MVHGGSHQPLNRGPDSMTPTMAVIYVVFCLLTGLCGIQRRLGFWGTFIISLLVTPIPVLLVLLLTAPRRLESERRQRN